jgi:hypothetical protein
MKRLALIVAALLVVSVADAQTLSPANMGIDKNTPQNLSVLDLSQHWAQLGTVDPATHTFTPLSGGGGASCTTSGAPCYVAAISGSFLDGWNQTAGTTGDGLCSSPTAACSEISMLRSIWAAVQGGVAIAGTPFPSPTVGFGANSGGNIQSVYQADGQAVINVSAAGTSQLINAVAGKRILVTGFDITGTGASTSAKFEYGTQASTACDTGATPLTGPYPPTSISRGGGLGVVWALPAATQLCLVVTGTSPQYSGSVSYTAAP